MFRCDECLYSVELCNSCYFERVAAGRAMHKALASGRLQKPDFCQACGRDAKGSDLHGHHHKGYARAVQLSVLWLCQPCHIIAHGKNPLVLPRSSMLPATELSVLNQRPRRPRRLRNKVVGRQIYNADTEEDSDECGGECGWCEGCGGCEDVN